MSKRAVSQGSWGGFYLATYIGAATYFVQHTHGFFGTIWGLIEALFWPAFVVYHALGLLGVTSL